MKKVKINKRKMVVQNPIAPLLYTDPRFKPTRFKPKIISRQTLRTQMKKGLFSSETGPFAIAA